MLLKLKFFDEENWSAVATVKTIVALIVLWALGISLLPSVLVFSTILAMMYDSDLLTKLIFTFFLCMMLSLDSRRGVDFFNFTGPFIVAALVLHALRDNEKIKDISEVKVVRFLLFAAVAVWMIYFSLLIFNSLKI